MERVSSPFCLKKSPAQKLLKSFENASAPFTTDEYDAVWKDPKYYPWNFQRYLDFNVSAKAPLIAASLTPFDRSATTATRRASFRHFGKMTALSSLSTQMAAGRRTSISTVTWRPSVFIRIGIVNYPSSLPCKTVSESGNPMSWKD